MGFFTFAPDLPHQLAAAHAVAELFAGLGRRAATFGDGENLVANAGERDGLSPELLAENLRRIQQAHNREHPEAPLTPGPLVRDEGPLLPGVSEGTHACPHFTIEMETGTGKTYVYLRTMLELHRRYGFTKFVVVVPSVAILEGVKRSFDDLRDHLRALYVGTPFSRRVYDGGRPAIVPAFARDVFPSVLILTQQSFHRASNNLYKASDSVISERTPHEWLKHTRPIVILDEPQNMGTERSKQAIRTLRPLCVLRYSATHRPREQPNPVHRLTPVSAFRQGLVKQVQVTGIADLGISGLSSLRLLEVTRRGGTPVAKLRALCLEPNHETRTRELIVRQGERLFDRTRLPAHEGLRVANIRAASDGIAAAIELDDGRLLTADDELPASSEAAWRAQIEETIRTHFARQHELKPHGVKVLSLFFLDRVANYVGDRPRIRALFDQCFDELKRSEPDFRGFAAEEVREGYFAKTAHGFVDEVGEDSKEAKEAFALIMRKKEVLLSFPNDEDPGSKVAFLFAHSALREGWDNPNVFQICTLNQTVSAIRKRQEIGRGLRLCVNQRGERLTDPSLNVLTVIANESYESYVRALQTEYREAGQEAPPAPARSGEGVAPSADEAFQRFWDTLRGRLAYTIELDTEALVGEAIRALHATVFPAPRIAITRGRFTIAEAAGPTGSETHLQSAAEGTPPIPDFIGRAAEETHLTRATLWRIFRGVSAAQREALRVDPEGWANTFVRVVGRVAKAHVVERLVLRWPREIAIAELEAHVHVERNTGLFRFPPRARLHLPPILGAFRPEWGVLRRATGEPAELRLVAGHAGQGGG